MPGTDWRSSTIALQSEVHCWLLQRRTEGPFVPVHVFGTCQHVPRASPRVQVNACSRLHLASPAQPAVRVHAAAFAPHCPVAATFAPCEAATVEFQYVT